MRHILELSKKEKLEFINSFDIVFSDCDGVLWLASEPILNADKAVNLLVSSGKKFICVSNNSMRTDAEYIEKLSQFGMNDATEDNFVHPIKSILRYLKKINFNGPIFSIADKVLNNILSEAGYEILESPNQNFSSINEFASYIQSNTKILAKAVLLDIDLNLTISKLVQAQYFLKESDCLLIVAASDKFIPLYKNFNVIGVEAFINLLSEISGKTPLLLGKPGKLLGEYLIEHYKVKNPKRALFVGDALLQDISFGKICNFQTLAVLSGATTKNMLFQNKDENKTPDLYADSIADFIKLFEEIN